MILMFVYFDSRDYQFSERKVLCIKCASYRTLFQQIHSQHQFLLITRCNYKKLRSSTGSFLVSNRNSHLLTTSLLCRYQKRTNMRSTLLAVIATASVADAYVQLVVKTPPGQETVPADGWTCKYFCEIMLRRPPLKS